MDLSGKVITCQNVSAAATAPNGQSHHIGHLSDLANVNMKTATHWSERRDCAACPVLQLCQGSGMFLDGPLWEAGCDSAYSDNVPFFAAAIEFLTGYTPYYIEGDFRDERKDLFGKVRAVPEAQKNVSSQSTPCLYRATVFRPTARLVQIRAVFFIFGEPNVRRSRKTIYPSASRHLELAA